jgi:leucyl-tRNA---protein transferase
MSLPTCEFLIPLPSLSASRMDKLLARGWFRYAQTVFRTQLQYMDGQIYTPLNIRMRVQEEFLPKRMQKLLNKNKKRFWYEIQPATYSPERQYIYDQHKARLSGYFPYDLRQLIHLTDDSVFDTWEVSVYDGDNMVAISYFDMGQESIASISGLFDPAYSSHSLGLFTMLLEIEFAKNANLKFYYPGYVLDLPTLYDYKLRIGEVELFDWQTNRWKKYRKPYAYTYGAEIREASELLEKWLETFKIPHRKMYYPFYSWAYRRDFHDHHKLLHQPIIFFLDAVPSKQFFMAYDIETHQYCLGEYQLYGIFESDYQQHRTEEEIPEVYELVKMYGMSQDILAIFLSMKEMIG